jgi:RNA polymerase sigma factor (TIGR02999 family)
VEESVSGEVTRLLGAWCAGDLSARDQLIPMVYSDLRRIAAARLRGERAEHTFQPPDLVGEAYLRLVNQKHVSWKSRAHFLSIAAMQMRRILIDHAREKVAAKRGGIGVNLPFTESIGIPNELDDLRLLRLDEALTALKDLDPLQHDIVQLRFFGGMTHGEMAETLGISTATIDRKWRMARAWLRREVAKEL